MATHCFTTSIGRIGKVMKEDHDADTVYTTEEVYKYIQKPSATRRELILGEGELGTIETPMADPGVYY
jgi:hypothetical protein